MMPKRSKSYFLKILLLFISLLLSSSTSYAYIAPDGPGAFAEGQVLFRQGEYDSAAMELWKAVLWHEQTPADKKYDVQQVFQLFMQCYMIQGRLADGMAFVSGESFRRKQTEMGHNYLKQALEIDPQNEAGLAVKREFVDGDPAQAHYVQQSTATGKVEEEDEFRGKTPEELYEVASGHFSNKEYEDCADIFEISCERSGYRLGPSCANAAYCRSYVLDWGFNGTRFEADMQRITTLTEDETKQFRVSNGSSFFWRRSTSVHPHMMLGYPIDSMLKRYATESCAFMDEKMARIKNDRSLTPLPDGMPFSTKPQPYVEERNSSPNYRIHVGFVSCGFNSKAVMYLSHDMFRFFDKSKFEIHIFSFGPPDNPMFIQHGMRGVDWRERVKANVDHFHDMQAMKMDHIKAARYIHDQNIHILIEWDGYARQGERAQGLFDLRPAPLQMLHQEYLGTSGALYVDYLFTDKVTSPPEYHDLYVEKLIYMPNHFFSKGHAYQSEVKKPTYQYAPKTFPYELGTGSPQENRCLAPTSIGPRNVSFVFCNFNKFLKNNPETMRSWIRILREVPDSILCLLENPTHGVDYLRKFVHETAGFSDNNSDPNSFVPGDGDALNERIHFLKWERNPFDHQMRSQDFCNVMLDSFPYNGHTVAQDALYGGVPIVTRSDGKDMASRVTTSANIVLGLEHLNAYDGTKQYEQIAIAIGTNFTRYSETRNKLIGTALQRNPMHPYWDVARYVKNFETGLGIAWNRFLAGQAPDHITIVESDEITKGTYDYEISAHPPEGPLIETK